MLLHKNGVKSSHLNLFGGSKQRGYCYFPFSKFYATVEDITHLTNRRRFSNDLALWYGLEIYPDHLEF